MLAELQSALRRELETGELLDLEEDFYDAVQGWLAALSSRVKGGEDEATAMLVERARETVKKLFLLRLIKELRYVWAYNNLPEKKLPKQEAAILERILNVIEEVAGERSEKTGGAQARTSRAAASPTQRLSVVALVHFKKPYSKLVLSNGKLLGPFSVGDLAILPESDARMLASIGVAEILASFAMRDSS